jgi:A/G-specific adenine glycosylase
MREQVTAPNITSALLDWYDREQRTLPWRTEDPDPYKVWLSEVMLQQTTVATVTPRYTQFLKRWPDVAALARASLDDVLHEWQGLGYYARARNLHACSQAVIKDHDGCFPPTEDGLRALPGIGEYTAAAIAAIAFGQSTAPVDGNIIRVISRLDALEDEMPGGKKHVKERVAALVPVGRAGDFAQAMMDLGAGICKPKNPHCDRCPWAGQCVATKQGDPASYPRKAPKKERPTRYGVVFWLEDETGRVFLQRRAEKGLLGGMMEFPSTDWLSEQVPQDLAAQQAPLHAIDWQRLAGEVMHTFTHFHLRLVVWKGLGSSKGNLDNGLWVHPDDFGDHALPTVMKKVVAAV